MISVFGLFRKPFRSSTGAHGLRDLSEEASFFLSDGGRDRCTCTDLVFLFEGKGKD